MNTSTSPSPFFSIIIPTYNRANELSNCLYHLTIQTYQNFEVIVCDDGSTDNTKEIASLFYDKLDLKYIWEENWGGPARPRNNGLKIAKGDWICFLDSDDWWTSDKLKQILNYIDDFDFIYHSMNIRSKMPSIISKRVLRSRQVKPDVACDLLIHANVIPNSSVVIKKSIINKIGYLSEDKKLIAVEDFDYWLRVSLVSNRFKYISNPLGYYWIGDNISNSLEKLDKIDYLYAKYNYLLTNKQLKYANNMLKYNKARLLQQHGYLHKSFFIYIKLLFSHINFQLRIYSFLGAILTIIGCRR